MQTVTLSPKYQVVIPKMIRQKLDLKPGQKFQLIQYADRIEFIPLKDIKEMRGILKGIDANITREKNRT